MLRIPHPFRTETIGRAESDCIIISSQCTGYDPDDHGRQRGVLDRNPDSPEHQRSWLPTEMGS